MFLKALLLMDFRILGSWIEYFQASKRLEEIMNAPAGTPEALERKKLIDLFRAFEKDIYKSKSTASSKIT